MQNYNTGSLNIIFRRDFLQESSFPAFMFFGFPHSDWRRESGEICENAEVAEIREWPIFVGSDVTCK